MTELKPRGFAALTVDRRREIARLGGKSIPSTKRYFAADREGAREAGRKGGSATPPATRNDIAFLTSISNQAFTVTPRSTKRSRAMAARLMRLGFLEVLKELPAETTYLITDVGREALKSQKVA